MASKLDDMGADWAWVSYLGSVKACLDYLGVDISRPWLYGGSGWAFVMCMGPDADPAGPVAWDAVCVNPCSPANPGMVARLAPDLGYQIEAVCGCPFGACRDLEDAKQRAFALVRRSIDQGIPCMVYDLDYPEFFVVTGYDEVGYHYLAPGPDGGPATPAGPKPWQEIAACVGWVRAQAVRRHAPAADEVVVRQALGAVVERMTRPPDGSIFATGLAGYDLWAQALEEGKAQDFGHRCCAASYAELRREGVAFLREARTRLPGRADGLFDEASGWYGLASERLEQLCDLHPFRNEGNERIRSGEAAQLLREAKAAEAEGLPVLGRIAETLSFRSRAAEGAGRPPV